MNLGEWQASAWGLRVQPRSPRIPGGRPSKTPVSRADGGAAARAADKGEGVMHGGGATRQHPRGCGFTPRWRRIPRHWVMAAVPAAGARLSSLPAQPQQRHCPSPCVTEDAALGPHCMRRRSRGEGVVARAGRQSLGSPRGRPPLTGQCNVGSPVWGRHSCRVRPDTHQPWGPEPPPSRKQLWGRPWLQVRRRRLGTLQAQGCLAGRLASASASKVRKSSEGTGLCLKRKD